VSASELILLSNNIYFILYSKNFEKVKNEIERKIDLLKSKITEDYKVAIPTKLPWYPSGLAYTFNELSRSDMRKLLEFKVNFLV
jgi:hypothetical protein